eukprot:1780098-Rhodomonas_salina.2
MPLRPAAGGLGNGGSGRVSSYAVLRRRFYAMSGTDLGARDPRWAFLSTAFRTSITAERIQCARTFDMSVRTASGLSGTSLRVCDAGRRNQERFWYNRYRDHRPIRLISLTLRTVRAVFKTSNPLQAAMTKRLFWQYYPALSAYARPTPCPVLWSAYGARLVCLHPVRY